MAATALAAALSACGTTDKVVGRYRTASCQTVQVAAELDAPTLPPGFAPAAAPSGACANVVPSASASAVSLPIAGEGGLKTGTDLPERAMAAYVTALARLDGSATVLRSELGSSIGATSETAGVQDRTSFKRTIIVSVRLEGGFNPADRLEQTDVLIRLHRARFVSWDLLATDYQTIDAGKIGLVTTIGSSQGLSVGAPAGAPVTASATLGATQSSARTENLEAIAKVPNLSATVDGDGNLRIFRRGGYGVDLSGNSVIRAEIRYTGEAGPGDRGPFNPNYTEIWQIGPYSDGAGKRLAPPKVKASPRSTLEAPPGSAIRADVYLNYTLRHVLGGGGSYEEKDDDVLSLTSGPVHRQVVLVPGRDVDTPGVKIVVPGGTHMGVLNVRRPGADIADLCFGSSLEAMNFLRYVRTAPGGPPPSLGGVEIGAAGAGPGVPGIVRLTAADVDAAGPVQGCR